MRGGGVTERVKVREQQRMKKEKRVKRPSFIMLVSLSVVAQKFTAGCH